MIVVLLTLSLALLVVAVVLLVKVIADRTKKIEGLVGALSVDESIVELRVAVRDLVDAARVARESADRLEATQKEEK